MDYHIYTIPLWDAYKKNSECPLCDIYHMLEEQYLGSALGGAAMESDIRIAVNTSGFCQRHVHRLNEMESVLPLSLMLHTHLVDVTEKLTPYLDALQAEIDREAGLPVPSRIVKGLKKSGSISDAVSGLAQEAQKRADSCYFCEKIESGLQRYTETIFHMYKTEKDFPKTFAESKGFCIAHLPLVVRKAADKLSGGTRRDFLRDLVAAQKNDMNRLAGEVEYFTKKFDYRNADLPWGNSKEAVPNAITKLTGPFPPK